MTHFKSAKKITNIDSLRSVLEDMLNAPERWTVPVTNFAAKGAKLVGSGDDAMIMSGKEILCTVTDYVITMQSGAKFVAFSPELKERIERKDFSWVA